MKATRKRKLNSRQENDIHLKPLIKNNYGTRFKKFVKA